MFAGPASAEPESEGASVAALLQAQPDDGWLISVRGDQGRSSNSSWLQAVPAGIRESALVMAGPDEPAPGRPGPKPCTMAGSTSSRSPLRNS